MLAASALRATVRCGRENRARLDRIPGPMVTHEGHSIARRTAYATMAQVVSLIAGFASAIITARLLGASGRGVLALAGLIGTIVVGGLSFGIGPALSFLMGKRRYSLATLIIASVFYAALFGFPVAILLLLSGNVLLEGMLAGLTYGDLLWIAAGLPAGYAFLFIGQVLVGAGRIRLFSGLNALNAVLYPVAVVTVVLTAGPDAHAVVAALTVVSWIMAIAGFVRSGVGRGAVPSHLHEIVREAGPFGLRVWLGQALYLFYLRADSFFINYYDGVAAVGVYSIAVTLAEKIWVIAGAATQSIFRDIAGASLEDSVALTMRAARLTLVFALASALVLTVLSPLVPVIFGDEFSASIVPLLVLLPGIVFVSVGNVYSNFYVGQLGKPGTGSAVSAVMMVVSLVLYVTLIPALGVVGGAVASSASYSVSLLAWMMLFPRATGAARRDMVVPRREDLRAARRAIAREFGRSSRSADSRSV